MFWRFRRFLLSGSPSSKLKSLRVHTLHPTPSLSLTGIFSGKFHTPITYPRSDHAPAHQRPLSAFVWSLERGPQWEREISILVSDSNLDSNLMGICFSSQEELSSLNYHLGMLKFISSCGKIRSFVLYLSFFVNILLCWLRAACDWSFHGHALITKSLT